MGQITLGLAQVMIGVAAPTGTMPTSLAKIGKTYKDTCKLSQAASDVKEHFEEGAAAPEVSKKKKKIPQLTLSIMDPDVDALVKYVGGTKTEAVEGVSPAKWGYDGSESVSDAAIQVQTEQGLWFDIPNGSIEAVIDGTLSADGILLVNITVTPLAVSAGKPISAYVPLAG